MTNTTTQEGLQKERERRVKEYARAHNTVGIVRLIGGSVNDMNDYQPSDAGEAPRSNE